MILPKTLGGSGATPAIKTKIPWTILPESPGGSGAPIGFINPGSLMDRLPSKGLAQQINTTNNTQLLGRPKYLNNRPEGRSNHRPDDLAEEERRPFLTPAHLSDWSARFGLQSAFGWPLRPEGLAKHHFRL